MVNMEEKKMLDFIKNVLVNMPLGWLNITTHRLDIYDEKMAKTDFLNGFELLFKELNSSKLALSQLPTAYDYIRLGHPLSCVLEWMLAKQENTKSENVISFSSKSTPILAILRKNHLIQKKTQIIYSTSLPACFDEDVVMNVYGYDFQLDKVDDLEPGVVFEGSTVLVTEVQDFSEINHFNLSNKVDFFIAIHSSLGSVLIVNGEENENYISDIQHVRRRETIAMTPANCLSLLNLIVNDKKIEKFDSNKDKLSVLASIKDVTGCYTNPLVGSSGLSIQYAILMGLIDDAQQNHKGKKIKIIVPPNCYGGTNDQARRVAECLTNVEVLDLAVDGGQDMVKSIDSILDLLAEQDAVPYIIAEIPTNPRVEVPDLHLLRDALSKERKTTLGEKAISPVFILDQTFCPNVQFLGENDILATVKTISFASGSKFPSGGLCTAGYCVGNKSTASLMEKIEMHLLLCDNEATGLQYQLLANQMPSMNKRIAVAYKNTREFVNFIHEVLPEAKINFVSEELANQGFTPSVFSLDLPTKGITDEEREAYKRELNHKLINLMITEIPSESKYCVSYGQLKGCYWTIPATSTQGTTKEGDKDYIARVALSPDMDLELHKKVFLEFVGMM